MNLSVAKTRARERRVSKRGRDGRGVSRGGKFPVERTHFLGPSATSYLSIWPPWLDSFFFILFLKYILDFIFYFLL